MLVLDPPDDHWGSRDTGRRWPVLTSRVLAGVAEIVK